MARNQSEAQGELPAVCMMFGRARCGTTVFRSMLSTHPQVVDLAEVFNSGGSYFQYLESRLRKDPSLCQPEHSIPLFRDYVEDARQKHRGARVLVLDAKRECLHVVYRSWQPVRAEAAVLEETRRQGWHVLHVTRRNHLGRVVSNARAQQSGVYHRLPGRVGGLGGSSGPVTGEKVRVSLHRLRQKLDEFERDRVALSVFFRRHERFLEIDYEEMFEGSGAGAGFSPALLARVAGFLEVEPMFDASPREVKLASSSLRDLIENYDEVEAALRGTPYSALLE